MASQSKIDIWNRALDRIGQTETIEDEDDDSVAAAVCERHWDDCAGEALELRDWPFARMQASIAELADVERLGWEHAYALPADFVAARGLIVGGRRLSLEADADDTTPHELQSNDAGDGMILLCDVDLDPDTDCLVYTRQLDVDVVARWPRLFVSAVAWRLAGELALALVKDRKLADGCLKMFASALADAGATQASQGRRDPEADASSIRARR